MVCISSPTEIAWVNSCGPSCSSHGGRPAVERKGPHRHGRCPSVCPSVTCEGHGLPVCHGAAAILGGVGGVLCPLQGQPGGVGGGRGSVRRKLRRSYRELCWPGRPALNRRSGMVRLWIGVCS